MTSTRLALVGAAIFCAVAAGGCRIGNSTNDCATGATCVCDGIGNCERTCTGGDCDFVCRGIGNCILDCPGGGCSMSCMGTGNCTLACAGGGCTTDCDDLTGNCICESGCSSSGEDAGPTSP